MEPMKPAVRQLLMGKGQECQVPSGFDWTPPIKVFRRGNRYTTNYRAEDWIPTTTAKLYVASTGNDTTGTGTEANPYRSIKKAITSMVAATEILVKGGSGATGFYNRLNGWGSTASPAFNFVVRAYDGDVICSTAWEGGTWTLTTSGTYSATRSTVGGVIDAAFLTSDGVPTRLTSVASQAACEAAPGTWYTNGTTVYVHTQDGRSPDSNVRVLMAISNGYFANDVVGYVYGINFEGAANGTFGSADASLTSASRIVLDTCKFTYGDTNGLRALGLGLCISRNCTQYGNLADGFNYHVGTTNLLDVKAIEIDCTAYAIGDTADVSYNDNGSTAHEACRVVRINTTARNCVGPLFAEIDTSKSWNLGCTATTSLAVGVQNSGFQASDTASQWMDGCTATGVTLAARNSGTGFQYQRNCNLGAALTY